MKLHNTLFVLISANLLLLSFGLTYLIRQIALRHNIIDIPNERSSHLNPVPRGGGLAIVICWYTGITALYLLDSINPKLYFSLMSGILIAVISMLDDIYNIRPVIRILVQGTVAVIAYSILGGVAEMEFSVIQIKSSFFIFPFAIIGIVWFINLFNFLDGIDGYASMEAIMVALGMFLLTGNLINLILVASIVGFLLWNWPKAKIFMGDVGSTQLGFILIIMAIYFHNESQINLVIFLILSSLFWFDATLTLYRRWKNKEELSKAHKKHAYQRAVQSGLTHLQVNFFAVIINIGLFLLLSAALSYNLPLLPVFIFCLFFLYGITIIVDTRFPFR